MWPTVLWVFVVALVSSGWAIWFEYVSRGREEDGNDDEDMRTLRRVLSWHAERIERLETELQLQEAGARRRLSREGFSRSTGSL
jgi:hypothetical protein